MRCGMAARAGAQAAECSETTVAPERHVSGRLDERALDCVWADSDLLALEFEAIVSANYPTSADRPDRHPPTRRLSVQTGRTPTAHHVGRRENTPAPAGSRPTRRRAFARERGPPRDDDRNSSHGHSSPMVKQSYGHSRGGHSSDGLDRTRRCIAANVPWQSFRQPPTPHS